MPNTYIVRHNSEDAQIFGSLQARVDSDDRDIGGHGSLYGCRQGIRVRNRDNETVDIGLDGRIDTGAHQADVVRTRI